MNNIAVRIIVSGQSRMAFLDELTIPAMNYGQASRYKGCEQVEIELRIEKADFLNRIQPWFDQFRLECIADQEFDEDDPNDVYVKFKNAGFPSLDEIQLHQIDLLIEILLECQLEVLELLLSINSGFPKYFINEMLGVSFGNEVIFKLVSFKKM